MPHAEMKSARRAKRELQQRTPLGGRRISSALTARSSSNTPNIPESESLSISAPIPKAPIPIITQTAPPTPPKGWRNPADLPFIAKAGKTWDDLAIIRFLRTKAAFSIPPRAASTADPWLLVRCPGAGVDGELVRLPRGYRIPLLWVAKFLWSSVELILSPADPAVRKDEWDDAKFDILHAARLCEYLLSAAAEAGAGMDRGWRCAAFDRALRRYWHRWLVSRDEFVRDFWREFGEEEYEGDVLKLGWGQWVLKGHKGFALMKQEVLNGIGVEEFTKGLVVDEDEGTFQWLPSTTESPTTEHHSHGSSTPSTVNSMPPVQAPEWRTVPVQALPTPPPSAASGNFVYVNVDARTQKIESGEENVLHNLAVNENDESRDVEMEMRDDESGVAGGASRHLQEQRGIQSQRQPLAEGSVGGSVRPALGCAPFRGHPTDVFRRLLSEERARSVSVSVSVAGSEENARAGSVVMSGGNDMEVEVEVEVSGGNDMEVEVEVEVEVGLEMDGGEMEGIDEDDEDEDMLELGTDDLELFYPSPEKQREAATPSHTTYAHSRSPSRSPSPPLAALSTAEFPNGDRDAHTVLVFPPPPPQKHVYQEVYAKVPSTGTPTPSASGSSSTTTTSTRPPPQTSTTSQLSLSPRRVLAELSGVPVPEAKATSLLARLAESWGELRAEVGALRAEVGALRAEVGALRAEVGALRAEVGALRAEMRGAVGVELEGRVRRLEGVDRDHGVGRALTMAEALSVSGEEFNSRAGSSVNARGRPHPLQHLISGFDEDEGGGMDVDVDGNGNGNGNGSGVQGLSRTRAHGGIPGTIANGYGPSGSGDGIPGRHDEVGTSLGERVGQPLPPRSRKFKSGHGVNSTVG